MIILFFLFNLVIKKMDIDIQILIQKEIQKYMEKNIFPIFEANNISYKHLLHNEDNIVEQNIINENKINETKIEKIVNFTELLKNCPKSDILLFKSNNQLDLNNIDWKELKKNVSNKIVENGGLVIPKDINTNKKLLEYIKDNFQYDWEIIIVKNDIFYKYSTDNELKITEPEYVESDIQLFKQQLIDKEYEVISCHINKLNIIDKLPKKKSYNIKDIYKYIFSISTKEKSVNVFDIILEEWTKNSEYELCYYDIIIKNLKNNLYYKYEYKYQLEEEFDYNLDKYVASSINLSNCYQSDEEQEEKPKYRTFEIEYN